MNKTLLEPETSEIQILSLWIGRSSLPTCDTRAGLRLRVGQTACRKGQRPDAMEVCREPSARPLSLRPVFESPIWKNGPSPGSFEALKGIFTEQLPDHLTPTQKSYVAIALQQHDKRRLFERALQMPSSSGSGGLGIVHLG